MEKFAINDYLEKLFLTTVYTLLIIQISGIIKSPENTIESIAIFILIMIISFYVVATNIFILFQYVGEATKTIIYGDPTNE